MAEISPVQWMPRRAPALRCVYATLGAIFFAAGLVWGLVR